MINNRRLLLLYLALAILSFNVFSNQPKICFFMDDNYKGESLCTTEGNSVSALLPKWNDDISSIYIPHGMVVSVYSDTDFSGISQTFKNNVDSLFYQRWTNLNDAISSFKVRSAACFYELDGFSGDSICLSGNESIDLYNNSDPIKRNYRIVNPLNDRVSSIKIPKNTQVSIYKNTDYSGANFVLVDDFSSDDLKLIGMNNNISSIKVFQQEYFICDQSCVIKGVMPIPLGHAFGKYWLDDRIKYKEALISLNLANDDDYSIELVDGGVIKVKGRVIYFIHNDKVNSFIFELNKKTTILSFLSRFNNGYFEVQFIESIGAKTVYISPIFGSLFDFGNISIKFTINNVNESKPLLIDKMVLTVEKVHHRTERSIVGTTACWLMPILGIYNYAVQGKCNQIDRFVRNAHDFFSRDDNKILQISGSAKPFPKINANDPIVFDGPFTHFSSQIEGTLTHINTDMSGEALTVPATALACKASLKEQLLPHLRSRRDSIPHCIDWTLNILTDFTLLFGDSLSSWNAESFGRVIERILKEGDTGYATSDTTAELRLIENVQAHLAKNNADIIHMKTAFDFSQLSYADYLRNNNPETTVQPPQVVQELPLGRYELALQNFHFIETVPRIRRGDKWQEDPELHFDIEVISGTTDETSVARHTVLPVIEEWQQLYHQTKKRLKISVSSEITDSPIITNDEIITASRLVSDVAQSWLRTSRDDYIYVIVRLSGQIISITMAIDINESDVGIAGSLTNPAYVLTPETEGSIRGAGTAAIRFLADHLSKKGKRSLVSDVISQPSAIVKKKVGFRFINEL